MRPLIEASSAPEDTKACLIDIPTDMGPLYTFFLDIKKAFDTVNRDMLMVKLHGKGVSGKVWRVIRAAYRQTRSKVTMHGATSAQFDLHQGVAQGCTLSPVLFVIFLDDLLRALHAQCRGDGVLSGTELRDFIGSLYADDFFAPSTREAGLQRIVTLVQAHSEDWDWHAHFTKSKGMLQFAAAECAPPQLTWGAHALPVCTQEKVLGVHVTSDGKWVKHLQAQLSAARFKLHQWRPVLSNSSHVLVVKLQALRTYVMPCVQCAMEVISPRAPDELAIVSEIDAFLEKALLLAVGIPVGLDSWRTRQCVKAAVVWHDLGVLRTMSQFELAHLRFDAKRMPALKQDAADSSAAHDQPTLRRTDLTEHIRSSLASGHAWRAFVSRASQRLQIAPCPPSTAPADAAPSGPTTIAASNAKCALRARNADAQRSLASVRVGRSTASQLPTRRSARVCARQHTLSANLDMFALVFQASSNKCPPPPPPPPPPRAALQVRGRDCAAARGAAVGPSARRPRVAVPRRGALARVCV